VVGFVIVSTLWHVVKTTKDNKKSFDVWQTKFPELIVFYEGKNSISAYSPSWFRPFLPPLKHFLPPEYIRQVSRNPQFLSHLPVLHKAQQDWRRAGT